MISVLNKATGRQAKRARLAFAAAAAGAAATLGVAPAAAVSVSGQSTTPTLIANLLAGTTYDVTVTGFADLFEGFNNGIGLTFFADGRPTYTFPGNSIFNPDGSVVDPDGNSGPAFGLNIGALVGSYTATPAPGPGSTDFFLIGLGTTSTPTADVSLYGLVNDSIYGDNGPEAFQVTVTPRVGAVPEPATWAMMIAGFGMIGRAMRRRGAGAAAVA